MLTFTHWSRSLAQRPLCHSAPRTPPHVDLERLSAALRSYKERLAARADRLFQSRDRDHWREQDLSFFEPGFKVPYKDVFPGDFDLIEEIDGRLVWFDDYHCMTAGCPCTTATIWVNLLGEAVQAPEVGEAEINLAVPRSRPCGDPEAAALLEQWLAEPRNRAALEYRRLEIRRIAVPVARHLGFSTPAAPVPKVGRNDPCPCGSGKKFKRCCLSSATRERSR